MGVWHKGERARARAWHFLPRNPRCSTQQGAASPPATSNAPPAAHRCVKLTAGRWLAEVHRREPRVQPRLVVFVSLLHPWPPHCTCLNGRPRSVSGDAPSPLRPPPPPPLRPPRPRVLFRSRDTPFLSPYHSTPLSASAPPNRDVLCCLPSNITQGCQPCSNQFSRNPGANIPQGMLHEAEQVARVTGRDEGARCSPDPPRAPCSSRTACRRTSRRWCSTYSARSSTRPSLPCARRS
jgi:hypothetical protein